MEDFNSVKLRLLDIVNIEYVEKAVLSNPIKKGLDYCSKVTVTRISLKGILHFQFSFFKDNKVTHKNIAANEENSNQNFISELIDAMYENFKQCSIFSDKIITVLMNKKKMFNIVSVKPNKDMEKEKTPKSLSHNNVKNYIIKEGEFIPWLFSLGVMTKDGVVVSQKQKKFRQINKFLETVDDIEKYIPDDGVIVDMGCGKSYLTFAMYHYFNIIKKKNVTVYGFDLKKDVVENCNRLAKEFEFGNLCFFADDIANIENYNKNVNVDMIITLHACDTATDYAMSYAVKWGCKVIMSVPCCQHELFSQIKNETLSPLLSHGILKERFSALLTDAIRAETLEMCGYKTNVMEFIDMEHTPKNIMIKAVKRNSFKLSDKKKAIYKNLLQSFKVEPSIYKLLCGQIFELEK